VGEQEFAHLLNAASIISDASAGFGELASHMPQESIGVKFVYRKNSNNWTTKNAVNLRRVLRIDLLVSVNRGFIISWQLIMQSFLLCWHHLHSD